MKYPKEKILLLFLILTLIFVFTSLIISSASEISVSARAGALYVQALDKFIYSKNADTRLPMASTTKIMTALVAIENSDLDSKVRINESVCGIEGSSLYLKPGEELSMRDLLYGLMLRSANDAAEAIAYEIAGGISEFAAMMNSKAADLGLKNTNFQNPHGLDAKDHYTTAKDLAIIASEALKNDELKEIASTYKKTITNTDGDVRLVVNHNKLLRLYDGAIGVKTGFTRKSGRCLVGAAEKDGLILVTVTIDAPDDWNDHIKMLDYGFSFYEMKKLATTGEFAYRLPVISGSATDVSVKNTDSLSMVLKKGANVSYDVELPRYLIAPVNEGDVIGKIVFRSGENEIAELNLVATEKSDKEKRSIFPFFK